MAINVNTYNKHNWVDNSSPDLEAEILNEIETGIGDNNDAIKAIAAAVVSQVVNDPDKIASMAALYAVNQTLGNLSTTVTNINSNLALKANISDLANKGAYTSDLNNVPAVVNALTFYRSAGNSANAPSADYGLVETMYVDSSAYAIQRFTSLSAPPKLFIRTKSSGTWGSWSEK